MSDVDHNKTKPNHGKITQEDIDRARAQIGVPQYERNPQHNSVATTDTMRHYAFGMGDDNPLWHDAEYGQTTRWRDQVALPLYVQVTNIDETPPPTPELKALFKGLFTGVGKYMTGGEWTFYRPITPGDVIYREQSTHDILVKESAKFRGQAVIDTYRTLYVTKIGEPVATYDLSYMNVEREKSSKSGAYDNFERATYTEEDIAKIDALYAAEERRGSEPRYFEDVQVGDALTPVVKGPLTVGDIIGFHISWGFGQQYATGPLRYNWKTRSKLKNFYSNDQYGVPDSMQRLHWDETRAKELGLPTSYDYGTMRTHWLTHLVTNWIGDDGWMFRINTRAKAFNFQGDTQICSGEVVGKRVEGLQHYVDIEMRCISQRGETTTTGTATVILPSREKGAVVLPTAADDIRQRGANMVSEAAARKRAAKG